MVAPLKRRSDLSNKEAKWGSGGSEVVEALQMTLGEEGYMGEGSAQRIEINGVSEI